MAAWTSKIWDDVIYMLEHGTKTCNMEHNTLFVNCTGYLPSEREGQKHIKHPGRRYPLLTDKWKTKHVNKERTGRGIYFTPGEKMQRAIDIQNQKVLTLDNQDPETNHAYSQTGR